MGTLIEIQDKLTQYHRNLGARILDYQSPLTGDAFPGEFNVSGFHKEVINLANNIENFYGTDRILRVKEGVNDTHSNIFHMGIFAKSIDLHNDYIEPFRDERFFKMQTETFQQFFEALKQLGISPNQLEATYLNGCKVGGTGSGHKNTLLKKQYTFPPDLHSAEILRKYGVTAYPVNSIANLDMIPYEGSLVGPRLEIAFRGVEIGTVIFDCFKIGCGKMLPINYVSGYALGIERLVFTLNKEESILNTSSKWKKAVELLSKNFPAIKSPLFKKELLITVFGTDVLAHVSEKSDLSKGQKELLRQLKKRISSALYQIGSKEEFIQELVGIYRHENTNNRS